ncbi:hypothetical protein SAMN04489731_106363 [Amycolatopsis regifaucium]|nr:hypothetical protein SAMN04489731_106363 [Amycolatopsis regifaucium]
MLLWKRIAAVGTAMGLQDILASPSLEVVRVSRR